LHAFSLKDKFKPENIEQVEENGKFYVIKSLYNEIYNCGKSLALIRVITPKVFYLIQITNYLLDFLKSLIFLSISYATTKDIIQNCELI